MRIAVDAMGGDKGPEVNAPAALLAAKADPNMEVVLVGDEPKVRAHLDASGSVPSNLSVVHASEAIEMHEPPASAVRKKKDSSIAVAMRMHKEGKADALVSAGNTGAVVAGSLVMLGRIPGVLRPAITAFYPSKKEWVVVLDVGANAECTPKNLVQFGAMGATCSEYLLDVKRPRVGLLNIGEEASKGNTEVREAYELMQNASMNFIGNVEGRDVFAGAADVVVCDGFVGNVVLKFSESVLSFLAQMLRSEIKKSAPAKVGALFMRGVASNIRARLDYAEYGGAPLLGINGVVIICHGSSSVRAVENAIAMAGRFVKYKVNSHIAEALKGSSGNVTTTT